MKDYPVTFLGAFETDLLSLTGAYTIFPNHGEWRRPHLISRIEDNNGHTLFRRADAPRRVISAESAWMTSRALEKVLKVGTASKAGDLGWKKPAGGKTGTTDAFKDAWFVGYTSSLTCGVWVGMDKPQTIMRKGYGAELALPIWVDIMKSAPDWNYPARELKPAVAITQAPLCRKSGQRATTSCVHAGAAFYELLPATRVPTDTCELHRPHIATRSYPPTTETPTLYLQQQEPSPNPGSRQPAHIASQRTNVSRAEPHPPPSTPSARDLQASRSPAQTDSQREEADFPEPLPVRRATPATPNASGRPREKVVYEQTPNGIRIWRIRPVHRRLTPNEEEEAPRTTQRHIPVRRAVPAIPGNAPTVAQLHDGDGELDD
jgi:membrane peptidoglycan carboxypeptidase